MSCYYFFPIPKLDPEVSHQSNQVELVRYVVEEGSEIIPGTPIAIVENYWAVLQIEATNNGIVSKTFFGPHTWIQVGDPIAIIICDVEGSTSDGPYSVAKVIKIKKEKPPRFHIEN